MNDILNNDFVNEFKSELTNKLQTAKKYKYSNNELKWENSMYKRCKVNFICETSDKKVDIIKNVSGVYYIYIERKGREDELIYIGESSTLRKRLLDHFKKATLNKEYKNGEKYFLAKYNNNFEHLYIKYIDIDDDIHKRKAIEELSYYVLINDKNGVPYTLADRKN